jgi:hypothetical protein
LEDERYRRLALGEVVLLRLRRKAAGLASAPRRLERRPQAVHWSVVRRALMAARCIAMACWWSSRDDNAFVETV